MISVLDTQDQALALVPVLVLALSAEEEEGVEVEALVIKRYLFLKYKKMKKIWLFILWILTLISSFSSASAIDPMNLPKFEHFINDYSNIFTEKQRLELWMLAKNIETNSGYQIVTVLFPHREGNELFDIALKAFNENKIWDKERNDGLLLAIATEEKKIRIIVWYGLEEKIPDLLAKQIIEEVIRPEVNDGNFYEAVKKFYEKLPEYLDGQAKKENLGSGISLAFGCCIAYVIISMIIATISSAVGSDKARNERRKRYKDSRYFTILYPLISKGILLGISWLFISAVLWKLIRWEFTENAILLFACIFLISIGITSNLSIFFWSKLWKRSRSTWSGRDSSSSSSRSSSDSDRGSSSSDSFDSGGGSSWGWGAGD